MHLRRARSILLSGCAALSVAKLALGQEAYYEQQVALGLDDYYAGRGESPGLWMGSGAEGLDLVGTVEEGALSALLSGLSPADGERFRTRARVESVRLDPELRSELVERARSEGTTRSEIIREALRRFLRAA